LALRDLLPPLFQHLEDPLVSKTVKKKADN
jgi:hypothetical protein